MFRKETLSRGFVVCKQKEFPSFLKAIFLPCKQGKKTAPAGLARAKRKKKQKYYQLERI